MKTARVAGLGVGLCVGLCLGLCLGLATSASAEPITVGPAQIELDAAWIGKPAVSDASPLLVRTRGEALLTVTRAAAGNTPAWRSATREAYIDEVEAGLVAAAGDGAVKLASKRRKVGKESVNALDVTLRRKGIGGQIEVVAVRVLLFRTLTIAAAAAAPDTRSGRGVVEAAVQTLVPR